MTHARFSEKTHALQVLGLPAASRGRKSRPRPRGTRQGPARNDLVVDTESRDGKRRRARGAARGKAEQGKRVDFHRVVLT
ncbi:hypothetical protein L543_2196 [Bordetella hinzii L60]|nr:hypothetical protein L543_2196 [Bordetella hinzii L60]